MAGALAWTFFLSFIAAIFIYAWWVFLIMFALAGIAILAGKRIERWLDKPHQHRKELAGLAYRAEQQHKQIMRGDIDSGTYGNYPPRI